MRASKYTRYNYSAKGQASRKRYEEAHPNRWGRSAECQRERYYRSQELAGSHRFVRDFFPAYRLLKAFETAEVVKI